MLKIASPSTGDPVKGGEIVDEKTSLSKPKPQIDLNFDIRDRLSELVGKGNTLGPDDKAAIYGSLQRTLGAEKAQKIMNHAYIFNGRSDVAKLPLEEKLKAFYTIGSNDADVNQLIQKSKSLGYGILPGLRESSSDINQNLVGRNVAVGGTGFSPETQRKVMLKVSR